MSSGNLDPAITGTFSHSEKFFPNAKEAFTSSQGWSYKL